MELICSNLLEIMVSFLNFISLHHQKHVFWYIVLFFLFAFVGQLSRLTVSKEIKIDWVNELQKGCIRLQNFFDIKSLTSALFTKSELLNVKDASMPNKFTVIFDYITGELGAYLMNLKRLLLPITMYAPMKHALLMYLMNLQEILYNLVLTL